MNSKSTPTRRAAGYAAAVGCLVALLSAGKAAAIPVSLNDFFHETDAPVTVSADGATATLGESDAFGLVYLSNVPELGDPEVIVGGAGVTLAFDYAFTLAANNADAFHVALLDGFTGAVLDTAYELFVLATGSGHQTFDLSALGGVRLGMQFELASEPDDGGFDSILTISNLQLLLKEPPPPPPPTDVPEPTSAFLLAGGLALLTARLRKRNQVSSNEVTRR